MKCEMIEDGLNSTNYHFHMKGEFVRSNQPNEPFLDQRGLIKLSRGLNEDLQTLTAYSRLGTSINYIKVTVQLSSLANIFKIRIMVQKVRMANGNTEIIMEANQTVYL